MASPRIIILPDGTGNAASSVWRTVEELASYSAAMTAAFQVLINCLQSNGALKRGQYQDDL